MAPNVLPSHFHRRSLAALFASAVVIASFQASCSRSGGDEAAEPVAQTPVRPKPRNLILISIDTLRADHVGCYGYDRPTTPRLDAYAARGTVFKNCTSSSAWTVPAHLTILTGVEPATHGCIHYSDPGRLNSKYTTLANIFSDRGFRTAAFTGGGYASDRYGINVGFDLYRSYGRRFAKNMGPMRQWLNLAMDGRPFFIFLHSFDAHRPYDPPDEYKDLFSDGYDGDFDVAGLRPKNPKPRDKDIKYIISQYDGEIRSVDDVLADWLDELDKQGVLDETLVVITSDHGDEFWEHGSCDHIKTLFDELVHVPWIMFGPGVPQTIVEDHVGTIDILPTVLELFGVDDPIALQGRSRVPEIEGDHGSSDVEDAIIYMFTGWHQPPYHWSGLRTDQWKLVTNLRPGAKNVRCPQCKENAEEPLLIALFDLKNDPLEQVNLANERPQLVADLMERLKNRIEQSEALGLAAEQNPPASKEHIEALKSLGYLD